MIRKEKYSIPVYPFGDELREVGEQLRQAVLAIDQLNTAEHKSSTLVRQGAKTIVADAADVCTQLLADAELKFIEQSYVLGNSTDNARLAQLQNYSNEVRGLLDRLKLDAGLFGWRRSAALRSVLLVKAYGWQTLLILIVAFGGLSLSSAVSKLIFMPAANTPTSTETKTSETEKQIPFVAVQAGQDLTASSNQTYEVFAEGVLLARKGSSGVARLGSTVVVTSGAQADVYGIAYAYRGAIIVLYPGGRVYAEPGTQVDNRGGELTILKLTDWPLRYRHM